MGGFLAKKMGLPIDKIVCATNANDIVHRTLSKGDMSMGENLAVSCWWFYFDSWFVFECILFVFNEMLTESEWN
jgi:hypothetical protein